MASSLSGKLVSQIAIKLNGDVLHELLSYRPHNLSHMSPSKIQGCDLHDGEWGKVGSTIFLNYFHARVAEVNEAIDEEKKSATYRVVEGDLMELYKSFSLAFHVDIKEEEHLVTWTLEYEKVKKDVPHPTTLMGYCLSLTKYIETHLLQLN